MVVEAAVLVVGDDEQRLVPLWAGPQRLVDLLDEHLALVHVVRRVVVVGRGDLRVHVPLLHHHVVGQLPTSGVGLEVEGVGVELGEVLELPQILVEERCRDVLVVDAEGETFCVKVLEYGSLRVALCQQPACGLSIKFKPTSRYVTGLVFLFLVFRFLAGLTC